MHEKYTEMISKCCTLINSIRDNCYNPFSYALRDAWQLFSTTRKH